MAFNAKELANVGYNAAIAGKARTVWLYVNDAADNVDAAGFFDAASDDLRPGDFIIDAGGRKLRFVDTITAGVVVLANANVTAV